MSAGLRIGVVDPALTVYAGVVLMSFVRFYCNYLFFLQSASAELNYTYYYKISTIVFDVTSKGPVPRNQLYESH